MKMNRPQSEYLVPVSCSWEPEELFSHQFGELVSSYLSECLGNCDSGNIRIEGHERNDTVSNGTDCFQWSSCQEDNYYEHYSLEGKTYVCNHCGQCFKFKSLLTRHIKYYTAKKKHKCPQCTKVFASPGSLKRHLNTHTGLKPFSCDVCEKTFSRKLYLVSHQRIHAASKPYSGTVNKEPCSSMGGQQEHQSTNTGSGLYFCNLCNESFSREEFFPKHLNHLKHLKRLKHQRLDIVSKPYSCDTCSKSFSREANLQRHQDVHTGSKPYSCTICKKSFTWESLRIHQYSHTDSGNGPYSSNVCEKSISSKGNLQMHKHDHTGFNTSSSSSPVLGGLSNFWADYVQGTTEIFSSLGDD